jgi:DNA modification methylase
MLCLYNQYMGKGTRTSSFGVSRRENHDSSSFYNRSLYMTQKTDTEPVLQAATGTSRSLEDWADQIYCQSAESLPLPDESIALAFTSPPYNVGKDYDENLSLADYLGLIERVGREVYRVLKPGGRYVINVANLGRKPYIPIHAYFFTVHGGVGFLPMGEIIWQKGKGSNGSCGWGSWRSARSPRLRDLHEYLLVFAKGDYSRPEPGPSDLSAEEFMESTLSVWNIPPVSARKIGHPAPFPLELAARVIKLYSYIGDVVLDPFAGSGTTCLAAKNLDRHYVGIERVEEYCSLAEDRLHSS